MLKSSNCKGGNFMLLFCRGRHGLVHKSVPHVQHDYFSTLGQSNSKFMALSLPFPSLMLKLSVYLENGAVIKSIGEFSI